MRQYFLILTAGLVFAGILVASNGQAKSNGNSPASSEAVLTNKDILGMVKAGLSPDVIIAKIQTSPCSFDTSPTALEELKAVGVPETVILAMVKAPNAGTSNEEPAHSAPLAQPQTASPQATKGMQVPRLTLPVFNPVIPSAPQVMLGPPEIKLPVMTENAQWGTPLKGVPEAPSKAQWGSPSEDEFRVCEGSDKEAELYASIDSALFQKPPSAMLVCGEKVTVLARDGQFAKVRASNGAIGYVLGDWLRKGSQKERAPMPQPAFNPPMPSAPNAASEGAPNEISAADVISGKVPCNDPRILSTDIDTSRGRIGPVDRKDFNFIMCVATRLTKGNRIALPPGFGQIWAIVPFHSQQINSEMVPKNGIMAVLAFDSMAKFVNYDQDEEAFVIGHEIGHILAATYCASIRAQANQAILFKQLALNHAQQVCEEHADFLGLQYMWGAGFNPFAAGAALGRFEMYLPDQTRGIASTLANFFEDHPISSERIKKLREETIRLCSQPGTVCHER